MKSAVVHSAVLDAASSVVVQIESGFSRGFSGTQLIGNATEISRAGKERAKVALEHLGIRIPPQRIVISLVPGDVRMDGNQFDLGIALSLALLIRDEPSTNLPDQWLFAAELGLSGELRPIRGVVPFSLAAMTASLKGIVVCDQNLPELAALAKCSADQCASFEMLGFGSLREVFAWIFAGTEPKYSARRQPPIKPAAPSQPLTFDDMILSKELEKVAIATASGMHSLLLRGCPGTGKSMFAARLPSILPRMPATEHLECLRVQSTHFERIPANILAGTPPFRSPHHGASSAALLGTADNPGELALAHGGILFLDEIPEFRRDLIEALREPLETGEVSLSRAARKLTWKSRIILVAACNNCPCGWKGSGKRNCICSQPRLVAYRMKLSGPILDRIDLHIMMPEPSKQTADMFLNLGKDRSSNMVQLAEQVQQARKFAMKRNHPAFGFHFNRDIKSSQILQASRLNEDRFRDLVNQQIPRSTSNRSIVRTLRVARTLADMEQKEAIGDTHIQQAWGWQAEAVAIALGEELPAKL